MSNTQPEPVGDKTWWLATWARYSETAECATILATNEREARQRIVELTCDKEKWAIKAIHRAEVTRITDGLIVATVAEH